MAKINVIVDLDGTLALDSHRAHHLQTEPRDWDSYFRLCSSDKPNTDVITLVNMLYDEGYDIHILSGRRDDCYLETVDWLAKHEVGYTYLQLRLTGDREQDHVLKPRWAQNLKLTPENTLLVIEDRQRVVDEWRRRGFTCLQVAPGNF
jgi:hypothetical protein